MLPIIVLGLAGLLFIFLEFFLPGIVMALIGALLLLASSFLFYLYSSGDLSLTFLYLIVLAAGTWLTIRLAITAVKATGKKGTVLLASDQEGFQASLFPKECIGKIGIAATDLKPSGHILVGEIALQALSNEGYIEKGTPIQILGGQGSHLIVKIKSEVIP